MDVAALMKDVDSDANIEVTDEDMNDPELLAELNEISDPGTIITFIYFPKLNNYKILKGSEDKLNKIQSLREQVALEKKKALELNSKGDKAGARQALTNAKSLQGQLDQLTGGSAASAAPNSNAAPASVAAAPAPVAAKPAPVRAPAISF